MLCNFRRVFNPTIEEQIELYERVINAHNELLGHCCTCVHHIPSDAPGFVEDHGRCDLNIPSFVTFVAYPATISDCIFYEEYTEGIDILKKKLKELKCSKN